jgi:hypothetical protein
MSVYDYTIDSIPWDFSNLDQETPYNNLLESDPVSVQETPHSDILQGHSPSRELAICRAENRMGFNAINPMINQSTS